MKLGLMLPQLRKTTEPAEATARQAEEQGVDGLFAFDHLWAPGRRDAPTLQPWPLLKAVAAVTDSISLGTLIARADTKPVDELIRLFADLRTVAGDRIVAGLGTGDRMTAEEDEIAGLPHRPFEERLELLRAACERLRGEGFVVWLAGSSVQIRSMAKDFDATVHLWDPSPEKLAAAEKGFTWGAVLGGSSADVAERLREPKAAGASWVVCGYRGGLDVVDAFSTLTQGYARLG